MIWLKSVTRVYDSISNRLLMSQYGCDSVSSLSVGGVAMHEVCLCVMLTGTKHPLVFASLVICDVSENAYCLYCLCQAMKKIGTTNVVVPVSSSLQEDVVVGPRKRLAKRSSSVYSLIHNLKATTDKTEQMGTCLYISATLLMRETMETIVPFQGLMVSTGTCYVIGPLSSLSLCLSLLQTTHVIQVLTILRKVDISTNSLSSSWTDNDYRMAIGYTILDLVVELIVFISTVIILRNISGDIKPLRIILGEIHMHSQLIFFLSTLAWLGVLIFQCTHSGVDLSFEFEWIGGCSTNMTSKTWIHVYEWECTNTTIFS